MPLLSQLFFEASNHRWPLLPQVVRSVFHGHHFCLQIGQALFRSGDVGPNVSLTRRQLDVLNFLFNCEDFGVHGLARRLLAGVDQVVGGG